MKNTFCSKFRLFGATLLLSAMTSVLLAGENDKDKIPGRQQKAQPGTYQFIASNPANQEAFTNDILFTIERLREQDREVIFDLTENTKVRILPRSVIDRPDFKPLKEVTSSLPK